MNILIDSVGGAALMYCPACCSPVWLLNLATEFYACSRNAGPAGRQRVRFGKICARKTLNPTVLLHDGLFRGL